MYNRAVVCLWAASPPHATGGGNCAGVFVRGATMPRSQAVVTSPPNGFASDISTCSATGKHARRGRVRPAIGCGKRRTKKAPLKKGGKVRERPTGLSEEIRCCDAMSATGVIIVKKVKQVNLTS